MTHHVSVSHSRRRGRGRMIASKTRPPKATHRAREQNRYFFPLVLLSRYSRLVFSVCTRHDRALLSLKTIGLLAHRQDTNHQMRGTWDGSTDGCIGKVQAQTHWKLLKEPSQFWQVRLDHCMLWAPFSSAEAHQMHSFKKKVLQCTHVCNPLWELLLGYQVSTGPNLPSSERHFWVQKKISNGSAACERGTEVLQNLALWCIYMRGHLLVALFRVV